MPDISAYATRSTVAGTDRIYIASATSDIIQVATAAQIAALGGGGSGPLYAPGWGNFRSAGGWNRPALSALTKINWSENGPVGTPGGPDCQAFDLEGGPIHFYGATNSWQALGVNPGTAPWTATFLLSFDGIYHEPHSIGTLVADTVSGKFMPMYLYNFSQPPTLYVDQWDSLESGPNYDAHQYQGQQLFPQSLMAMRIKFDGTNLTFWTSLDPLSDASFTQLYTQTSASWLSNGPNFVGIGLYGPSTFDNSILNLYGMEVTMP